MGAAMDAANLNPYTDPGHPWQGKTVFCLASGDSLRRLDASEWALIRDAQRDGDVVLAVNSSIKTARNGGCEPNALIFTDQNWFEDNEPLIRAFKGPVFTLSRRAKVAMPELLRLENITRGDFGLCPPLRDGRSTGHRAVSLAVMCGAKRVVMLGYDMRVDPDTGRSHCHDDYQHTETMKSYRDEFIPSFNGWHQDGLRVGCEIVNATDGTALDEFPKVRLMDVFAC